MAITFDFRNSGPSTTASGHSWSLTNVDDGVRFTLSDRDNNPSPEGLSLGLFGNNMTSVLQGASVSGTGTFTLSLQATSNAALTRFSGTVSDPVILQLMQTAASSSSSFTPIQGSWTVAFITEMGEAGTSYTGITSNATTVSLTAIGTFTSIQFINSSVTAGWISLESLTIGGLSCFCAGTMIATPQGEKPVEDLQPGDLVLTTDGESTVEWLGVQDIPVRLMHPKKINPICIKAGALGTGVPARDLYLSQDHAISIDGALYNAGALVNGSTIYQVTEMPLDGFKYYHVETGKHELLLAEGVAAESFIDYAGRDDFDNATEREGAPQIAEMDLPRFSTARLVPDALRARLAARAETESEVA